MTKSSLHGSKKLKKRTGFSLIVVLIISLIGLALVGATLQFTVSAGGSGRVANASGTRYTLLQAAVEEGKGVLMSAMDNVDPIPRHPNADANPEPPISELGGLLIDTDLGGPALGVVRRETLSPSALHRAGIWDTSGEGGVLTVSIYDMQYDPDVIDVPSMPAEDFSILPPSIMLDPASWRKDGDTILADEEDEVGVGLLNTGVYLIRAELLVGGRRTILDTAVFQSNNM